MVAGAWSWTPTPPTMRDEIASSEIVPSAVLSWQEEETRFAFQNGEAAFMRNWPYASAQLEARGESRVAGRFGVTLMPAGEGGVSGAALGGSNLAINANSKRPEEAYALVEYLTRPEQMIERAAAVGQFPARERLYDDDTLASALKIAPSVAREIVRHAVVRPVTPVYTELSEILQVHLHRVLTRQEAPRDGLLAAAASMRQILKRSGLGEGE
jgi:ABC-type glycerol-3-phosphate transport system substrate-binding protein